MIGGFYYDLVMLGKGTNHKYCSIIPILVRFLSLPRRCLKMIHGWFELDWPTSISERIEKRRFMMTACIFFQANIHTVFLIAGWYCCYFMPQACPCLLQGRTTSCRKLTNQLERKTHKSDVFMAHTSTHCSMHSPLGIHQWHPCDSLLYFWVWDNTGALVSHCGVPESQ